MSLYLRYFENEMLVANADEAIEFIHSIGEIKLTPEMEKDIREYALNDVFYPKRYKVRPRVYFIVIKTEAETMEDFKAKKALRPVSDPRNMDNSVISRINRELNGWYEGRLDFKRVIQSPSTGKCEYRDTTFVARVKASSGADCYNRIVAYLSTRVDHRSQFPSVKGKNFSFEFLGLCKES